MTNLHTKIFFIALVALLVALAGCKKDEETIPSFSIESTSLDFEWGQIKELSYTTYRIKSFEDPEVPDGWTCTRSKDRFVITAPAEGANTDLAGSITLKAQSEANTTLTRTIIVAVRIAEEIPGGANSIIVSEPAKRYKFKALRRGNESTETITGAVKATRVWSTSSTAIINVSFENGYIYFATENSSELAEANSLVAVTDGNNNILWSWHIWTTDYDPAAEPDILNGLKVMNRNLGAFANSNETPKDALLSYGLYYQWGRKDPFIGPAAWDSTTPRSLYGPSGSHITHSYAVSGDAVNDSSTGYVGSIEYAVAHPNTFIAGNEQNGFDWQSGELRSDLWSSGTTPKTIYDPCPAGWRVAPPSIWSGFTTTGSASSDLAEFNIEGEYQYGWTFTNGEEIVFYPAAGRRSFSPTLAASSTNFTNVVNDNEGIGYPVGFYWSSEHPAHAATTPVYPFAGVSSLAFRHNYVNPASMVGSREQHAPAGGFPLRCVEE